MKVQLPFGTFMVNCQCQFLTGLMAGSCFLTGTSLMAITSYLQTHTVAPATLFFGMGCLISVGDSLCKLLDIKYIPKSAKVITYPLVKPFIARQKACTHIR